MRFEQTKVLDMGCQGPNNGGWLEHVLKFFQRYIRTWYIITLVSGHIGVNLAIAEA